MAIPTPITRSSGIRSFARNSIILIAYPDLLSCPAFNDVAGGSNDEDTIHAYTFYVVG
jgi:hypothetical protein